jgi:hypothetical protein
MGPHGTNSHLHPTKLPERFLPVRPSLGRRGSRSWMQMVHQVASNITPWSAGAAGAPEQLRSAKLMRITPVPDRQIDGRFGAAFSLAMHSSGTCMPGPHDASSASTGIIRKDAVGLRAPRRPALWCGGLRELLRSCGGSPRLAWRSSSGRGVCSFCQCLHCECSANRRKPAREVPIAEDRQVERCGPLHLRNQLCLRPRALRNDWLQVSSDGHSGCGKEPRAGPPRHSRARSPLAAVILQGAVETKPWQLREFPTLSAGE